MPLSMANAIVFAPLAAADLLAAVVAAFLPGQERQGRAKQFTARAAAMFTIPLLLGWWDAWSILRRLLGSRE